MVNATAHGAQMHVDDFTQGGANAAKAAASPAGTVPRYYGEALLALARERSHITVLSADLTSPTETDLFRDAFPERFVMPGIAEANMVGLAGGLARSGLQPWVHTFSVFATRRAYDQIAMQIAYPKLDAKIVGFLPGLSTILGVSHQAIDDVALMRALPNMTIIEPSGPAQVPAAVRAAADHPGPVYLRMIRAAAALPDGTPWQPLTIGSAQPLQEGRDLLLLASGLSVEPALSAAQRMRADGIDAAVANLPTIKPLDEAFIAKAASRYRLIVTIENHSIIGGLGSAVAEQLAELGSPCRLLRIGVQDTFAEGASLAYLFERHGLSAEAIARAVSAKWRDVAKEASR